MKIFAKEINGKVWGLFLNFESATQKNVKGFGKNYFETVYPKSGFAFNNFKTDGIGWDDMGHYRFQNIWRVFTLRFKGFGFYKSISLKLANETTRPNYISKNN